MVTQIIRISKRGSHNKHSESVCFLSKAYLNDLFVYFNFFYVIFLMFIRYLRPTRTVVNNTVTQTILFSNSVAGIGLRSEREKRLRFA